MNSSSYSVNAKQMPTKASINDHTRIMNVSGSCKTRGCFLVSFPKAEFSLCKDSIVVFFLISMKKPQPLLPLTTAISGKAVDEKSRQCADAYDGISDRSPY
jgi:hypothetical protein